MSWKVELPEILYRLRLFICPSFKIEIELNQNSFFSFSLAFFFPLIMYTKQMQSSDFLDAVTGCRENIIPAIASTNAIISAACALDTLKIVTGCTKNLRNYVTYVRCRSDLLFL